MGERLEQPQRWCFFRPSLTGGILRHLLAVEFLIIFPYLVASSHFRAAPQSGLQSPEYVFESEHCSRREGQIFDLRPPASAFVGFFDGLAHKSRAKVARNSYRNAFSRATFAVWYNLIAY